MEKIIEMLLQIDDEETFKKSCKYIVFKDMFNSFESINALPLEFLKKLFRIYKLEDIIVGNGKKPTDYILLLSSWYLKMDSELISILKENKEIIFIQELGVDANYRFLISKYPVGVITTIRNIIVGEEKEKAESIFIEYYTDFLEALSSSYTENERAARLEYIYFRYVDPDPSEALRLFFRLHK